MHLFVNAGLFGMVSSRPPITAMSWEGKNTEAEKALKGWAISAFCIDQKSLQMSYSATLFVSHLAIFILRRIVDFTFNVFARPVKLAEFRFKSGVKCMLSPRMLCFKGNFCALSCPKFTNLLQLALSFIGPLLDILVDIVRLNFS